jgi:hypothetical protein
VVVIAALAAAVAGCGDPSIAGVEDFGARTAPIVGGITEPNHRYVVSIGGCTGTVISKHTVLTAGHCFGLLSSVKFGPTVAGATKTIRVVDKARDPMYADICDQDATYDLAVAKLEEPAPTQSAPLLRATLDNSPKYVGPSWVWVGYGRTGSAGGAGTKRATTFPIDLIGPASGRGSLCMIPETLIYSSVSGRNACNGDSGGPSFFVTGGVEYLAGVTSSGDDACMLDDTQQRSDQPYIDHFIQAQIDAFEGNDPCRSNGVCDETCNSGGQLGDPDCAQNHCGADGICAEACVAPRDPDCAAMDTNNCGDNGVCDLACPMDPDCVRDCGREGNCIPNCPMPDPDCTGGPFDAGARDVGSPVEAGIREAGPVDASPPFDAGTRDAASADEPIGTAPDAAIFDAATREAAPPVVPDAASGGRTEGGTDGGGCGCRAAGVPEGARGPWLLVLLGFACLRRAGRLRRPYTD